jgi:uncharacterized glyoxalase superfamily protein PhnB
MSTVSFRNGLSCSALGDGGILVRSGGCVSSPRFVDRRKELMALEAALARTREGFGSVVFVGGEAGIGKSRLISELAGRAERDGMTVAVGECPPLGGGELPYAPIVAALRSLMAQREQDGLEVMLGSVREEGLGFPWKQPGEVGAITQTIYVIVPDPDAHHARAKAAGAEILREVTDQDYGGRLYTCRDPEGHVWSFGSYDPWH